MMMMNDDKKLDELRPCPFCGKPAFRYEPEDGESIVEVGCINSYCDFMGETMAIKKWNTRPIEDILTANNAELLAACERAMAIWGDDVTYPRMTAKLRSAIATSKVKK